MTDQVQFKWRTHKHRKINVNLSAVILGSLSAIIDYVRQMPIIDPKCEETQPAYYPRYIGDDNRNRISIPLPYENEGYQDG